ncbi:hypothetical protein ANCCAN_03978 [Ancylostoma caninum]|uniref:Uncharacterized protein n=1 Tax=Ancylostoma caninum TaxID=29170 RepID=A0A368H019_ANCCA|nr:hypothetical protein ANCCAN_03978 [Ancylostoma caninum]
MEFCKIPVGHIDRCKISGANIASRPKPSSRFVWILVGTETTPCHALRGVATCFG